MKNFFKKTIVAGLCFFLTLTAHSYDVDTHFYGTYSMARFAGIRHEIAAKIATATQWMDESYISDPLSMIILPDVGVKKRRLLHFPGSRLASKIEINKLKIGLGLQKLIDPSSGAELKAVTETEEAHDFATEMFTEGLMEGNLMKAATGLHTLEDSFAHAGTIAELGHAHFWHHPDRPYVDEASVEKYFRMSRSVLRAMVAIRSLLPMSGIDTSVKFSGDKANYQMNGDELADIYTELPAVKTAISKKILNEPSFVKFVLENVFSRAEKAKYIEGNYQSQLSNFTPGQDAYQAAAKVIKEMPREMVNVSSIMFDTGRPDLKSLLSKEDKDDYILSMGGFDELLMNVVRGLLSGIVPRPMDASHKFEKEEDGPVWIEEVNLRVANMRTLILQLYGKDVYFVENNTKDEKGYFTELGGKDPSGETKLPPSNGKGTEYVTYSLKEKRDFDHMIFRFLFPTAFNFIKDDIDQADALIVEMQKSISLASDVVNRQGGTVSSIFGRVKDIASNKVDPRILTKVAPAAKLVNEDVRNARLNPNRFNKYYNVPSLLQKQIDRKIFKPLMTPQQVEALVKK